jgi:hypothetical protein
MIDLLPVPLWNQVRVRAPSPEGEADKKRLRWRADRKGDPFRGTGAIRMCRTQPQEQLG